ncbi:MULTISPECIES: hypothetical protein [Micromonospora]|uniref:Uncharacterized protein n=1 Tax=Micromonospora yangpuensis TaxID=683228 RepID=A0A1C6UF17_9ACTN|nr:hypothetical protein [Micromonospora yangpuensis]GGM06109.1 hypothetical protein GCM10012279_24870 [Micromonospora yangpuensis]SCL52554.1 hypothetical protein GA0070617_2110 [Micromonospora yangpuensis]
MADQGYLNSPDFSYDDLDALDLSTPASSWFPDLGFSRAGTPADLTPAAGAPARDPLPTLQSISQHLSLIDGKRHLPYRLTNKKLREYEESVGVREGKYRFLRNGRGDTVGVEETPDPRAEYYQFLRGLSSPEQGGGHAVPEIAPTPEIVSQWLDESGQPACKPRRLRNEHLAAFVSSHRLLPIYEFVRSGGGVAGITQLPLLGDEYSAFMQNLRIVQGGYSVPGTPVTQHVVSDWLHSSGKKYHKPSQVTAKDLREFEGWNNLRPGSHRIVRTSSGATAAIAEVPPVDVAQSSAVGATPNQSVAAIAQLGVPPAPSGQQPLPWQGGVAGLGYQPASSATLPPAAPRERHRQRFSHN